jgi:hypothetical protein
VTDNPEAAKNKLTAPEPKPERQIIHELCLLLDLVHTWGNEAGAIGAAPEWLKRRYEWALQQIEDAGGRVL